MSKGKRRSNYSTKKRGKGLRRKQRKAMRIVRAPRDAFIAPYYHTKLKYIERIVMSTVLGTHANYIFRGNSLYDPNYSGTGTQPLGHPTMALLYGKYRVMASKIKLSAVITEQGSGEGGYELSLIPANNGFGLTPTPEEIQANPRGKFRLCGNTGSGSKAVMSSYCRTNSIQGEKKIQVQTSDEDAALTNANPADVWFWILSVQPTDHTSQIELAVYVELTYYAKYEDRRPFNAGS